MGQPEKEFGVWRGFSGCLYGRWDGGRVSIRNTRRRFGLKSLPNLQTMERRRLADRLHQLATSRRRFILVLAPQLRFAPQAA